MKPRKRPPIGRVGMTRCQLPLLPKVVPVAPSKLTVAKAIKDFLKEHEGESAKTTIRTYRYLLEDFAEVSAEKGFVVLEQWGPAEIREFRKS
jgi:hypothetical protein